MEADKLVMKQGNMDKVYLIGLSYIRQEAPVLEMVQVAADILTMAQEVEAPEEEVLVAEALEVVVL